MGNQVSCLACLGHDGATGVPKAGPGGVSASDVQVSVKHASVLPGLAADPSAEAAKPLKVNGEAPLAKAPGSDTVAAAPEQPASQQEQQLNEQGSEAERKRKEALDFTAQWAASARAQPAHFATTDAAEVAPEIAPQVGLPYQVHMCGPPPPPCNEQRLATMQALQSVSPQMSQDVLDAPPDPEVNSILKLVASIFEAPAALVALFDDRRIFIRDSEGAFGRGDFPWRWSFCGWTMASKNDQIMVIPDATKDYRFSENNFVKNGPVRFYCGTPLIASNGHRLGTLCFADFKPRQFDASRCMILNNLAELVVRHIEKDIALQLRKHDNDGLTAAYGRLRRTLDCFDHCVALVDTGSAGWKLLYANMPCLKLLGVERDMVQGKGLDGLLEGLDGVTLPSPELVKGVNDCKEFSIRARLVAGLVAGSASGKRFALKFRPASKEDLDDETLSIGIPSFIPAKPKAEEEGKPGDEPKPHNPGSHPERLYFMLLEDVAKIEEREAAEAAKAAKVAAEAAAAVRQSSSLLSCAGSVMLPPESIEGLTLGHLLGKGGYGSVYYGTWFGTPVAVKVIDEELAAGASSIASHSEATLSAELRHPHIVATLRCATRVLPPRTASRLNPNSSWTAVTPNDNSITFTSNNTASNGTSVNNSRTRGSATPGSPTAASVAASAATGTTFSSKTNAASSDGGMLGASETPSVSDSHCCGGKPAANGPQASASEAGTAMGGVSEASGASANRWAIIQLSPGVSAADAVCDSRNTEEFAPFGCAPEGMAFNSRPPVDKHLTAGMMPAISELEQHNSSISPFAPPVNDSFDMPYSNPMMSGTKAPNAQPGDWHQGADSIAHQTWLVMEYCDKGCLQDAVDRGWLRNTSSCITSIPRMEAVLATAMEMASALSFLHARGIVHGDLSAWNVMLCTSGSSACAGGRGFVAKIADFGLARHLDVRTKVQTRNYGTLTHMPAETLRDGVVSKATDVYSFGVLLWQMYTGSRPWAGLRHGQIIAMVVTQGAFLRFPPGTPAAYEQLATSCMAHDPINRPTFTKILKDLETMCTDLE